MNTRYINERLVFTSMKKSQPTLSNIPYKADRVKNKMRTKLSILNVVLEF